MKYLVILCITLSIAGIVQAQPPSVNCSTDTNFRHFDFWLGNWEVFGAKGKAGDSKIELILDSCVILENWTSANGGYAGKSFNTFNKSTQQWQQTWVDNQGGTTEFLRGQYSNDMMVFYADNVSGPGGKQFLRRLTFHKISTVKVRQHGERSDDKGLSWITEYDLEYRRK